MHLERDEFRQWLDSQSDDDVVGVNRKCDVCPIATFLTQDKGLYVEVEPDTVYVELPNGEHTIEPLPAWARGFIADIDDVTDTPQPITAKTARRVLAGVLE